MKHPIWAITAGALTLGVAIHAIKKDQTYQNAKNSGMVPVALGILALSWYMALR